VEWAAEAAVSNSRRATREAMGLGEGNRGGYWIITKYGRQERKIALVCFGGIAEGGTDKPIGMRMLADPDKSCRHFMV